MEEKRRDAGTLDPAKAAESTASEPTSTTRRRASSQKRKSSTAFGSPNSSSSSAPSKRLTREKVSISHHHNGPLTRARQSPSHLSTAFPSASGVKIEEPPPVAEPVPVVDKVAEKREALEANIEAECEAIKSRNENVHVVPMFCGWFSWTKVHLLEERALPSFFNKESDRRNPDTYMDIRNWIMKKFHANPKTQIEAKDLSELEVADIEARQEVMEFLEYWGLINFHPRLPTNDDKANMVGNGEAARDSLLEKLYSFETPQTSVIVAPNNNLMSPAVSSGLFPESAFAEEIMRQEGPAVEYHCDSCSADCSRRRYHCQKEADFDLCADCFNNGKFGSNMSSSDFILMEPAEAHGVSGGKWTDQETLLLLEALELYKENWNEIAEHVATKTKAQCMLHFVQMPIEDAFLDCENNDGGTCKETNNPAAMDSDFSGLKEAPETTESKPVAGDGQATTSLTHTSKPDDSSEGKNSMETPKEDDTSDTIAGKETSKSNDTSDTKACQEASKPQDSSQVKVEDEFGENLALKALREAFEDIGYSLAPEGPRSFAAVGNPVMAVAAFLARLVGPDLASASARCSLRSLSRSYPGMQVASRHCYWLEDPPDEMKELGSERCRIDSGFIDQDSKKDENKEDNIQKEDNSTTGLDAQELSNNQKKIIKSTPDEVSNLHLTKDLQSKTVEKSDDGICNKNQLDGSTKEFGENNLVAMASQFKDATKDVGIVRHSQSADAKMARDVVPGSPPSDPSKNTEVSKDSHVISDTLIREGAESRHPVSSNSVGKSSEQLKAAEGLALSDHSPCIHTEDKNKCGKKDLESTIKNQNIDNVKRAALSALTAAAVKAKLLADEEEEEIQRLASSLIEKQLHKLETKLSLFNEMESLTMRVKEQLEKSRQRLYHERAQIIASRLGMPASSSRGVPNSLTANRMATNFSNSSPRAPMFLGQRPPLSRPIRTVNPSTTNPPASSAMHTGPVQSYNQGKLSAVGTKQLQ